MELAKFIRAVNDSPHYEGIGISGDGEVIIRDIAKGDIVIVPTEAIQGAKWDGIDDVLSGRTSPGSLGFKTGAPGYYGRAAKWPSSEGTLGHGEEA